MFIHIFLFRWKPAATKADKKRAESAIMAFAGVIPGLQFVAVGDNQSNHSKDFGFGGVMHFADQKMYEAYTVHPAHQSLLVWLAPLIDAVECDFLITRTA